MGYVRLPHGPWKSLLAGKYEDREMSIYQNPQRDLLYVVVDKDENGKPKGLVISVYRGFYVERGDVKTLLSNLSGNPVGVSKKWKGELFQFLLIPAGIKYIGLDPEELKETVDAMVVTLDRMEKNVVLLGKTLGMVLRPISLVPKNLAAVLFVEPSVIAGLAPIAAPKASESGVMILGITKTGEIVRESPENLRRIVVYGDPLGRKRMFLVLLEEFLRNGINAVVVTENPGIYSSLQRAGEKTDLHSKLGLQPMGFSEEEVKPLIDLAVVPREALVEVIGVKEGTQTAAKLVEVLNTFGVEAERPSDILGKIQETDLISLRVGRILKAVDLAKGDLFGRENYNRFISISSTGLGAAYVVEAKNPWDYLAVASLIEGIGRNLERTGKSEGVRVVLFVENAEKLFTRTENPITKAVIASLEKYKDFGLGWVLETEKDVNLNDLVLALTETKMGAIGENDIGVRTLVRRPYRLEPRPFLTGLSVVPLASSPRAPQPDRR